MRTVAKLRKPLKSRLPIPAPSSLPSFTLSQRNNSDFPILENETSCLLGGFTVIKTRLSRGLKKISRFGELFWMKSGNCRPLTLNRCRNLSPRKGWLKMKGMGLLISCFGDALLNSAFDPFGDHWQGLHHVIIISSVFLGEECLAIKMELVTTPVQGGICRFLFPLFIFRPLEIPSWFWRKRFFGWRRNGLNM